MQASNKQPMQIRDECRHFVLCFQVHQPRRLRKGGPDDLAGSGAFDDNLNREIMQRVGRECYLPANNLLLRLIDQFPGIRITFAISGTAIDQMEMFAPEILESFRMLAKTGSVDFLSEPHYHSLSFLMEGEEFEIQILEHAEKIYEHFQMRPAVFKNTQLIYNDEIGRRVSMMGFSGALIEGNVSRRVTPHVLYEHRDRNGLRLLLRNPRLSDDIAFRVASPEWNLTAEKYLSWLEEMPTDENLVTVALDYGTFGEHQRPETGVFDFLEHLLLLLAMQNNYRMTTAAEAAANFIPKQTLAIPDYTMAEGCDLYDWVGNDKQREAFSAITGLEATVKRIGDSRLLNEWRSLQSSDHFFYMSDKAEGSPLSPFVSTQEAFHHYMTAVEWLKKRIHSEDASTPDPEKINESLEAERRNINTPLWALSIDPNHGYHN